MPMDEKASFSSVCLSRGTLLNLCVAMFLFCFSNDAQRATGKAKDVPSGGDKHKQTH